MSTTIEELVRQANADLDAALITGGDTEAARARLRDAEAEQARIQAIAAEGIPCVDETILAEAIADTVVNRYNTAVSDLQGTVNSLLDGLAAPAVSLTMDDLHHAVQAEVALDHAMAERAAHLDRLRAMRDRQATLQRERKAIVARRAAGFVDDEADGRRLALLDADISGLAGLIDNAEALTPPEPNDLKNEASQWWHLWEVAQARAMLIAVHEIACDFERRMLAAATVLRDNSANHGTQHRWKPSTRVIEAVSRGVF